METRHKGGLPRHRNGALTGGYTSLSAAVNLREPSRPQI